MQNMFAFALIFCQVLASGRTASVIKSSPQSEYCSWGAQYWCSSPQTADLCGKTEWCAKNDWPHNIVQDYSCTVTQQIVKNARSLVRNSAEKPLTELDFAMFIAKGCSLFKEGKDRQKCKELATDKAILLKLVKLVDSKLSILSVATAVGMCHRNLPQEKPCLRCTNVVPTAQKYIAKFMTEDAFTKLLEAECVRLGQGRQLCQVIGQARYKDFYNGLISVSEQSVCEGKTQCLSVSSQIQPLQQTPADCEICKAVVKAIRELDQNPDIQAAIRNLFKSVCDKLGEFEQVCNILADEALDHLLELIATEMEPEVICEELKLCGPSKQKVAKQPSPVGTLKCEVCELILKEIDAAIEANVTEERLKLFLDNVCSRLPSPINTECTNIVTQYSSKIIQFLLREMDPEKVCTALGICQNGTAALQVKILPKIIKQNDEMCDLCKYVVTYLDTYLNKNATEAEIEAVLDKVCAILPGSLSQQCKSLVYQYGPLIVQLLKYELQPNTVCTFLGLCTGNKQATTQVKTQPKIIKQNDAMCDLCKYVVTYLDTYLDKNATEAEIEAVLHKVCAILPGSLSQQCESLVTKYGPLIVQLLKYELQPNTVCTVLELCAGNKQVVSQVKVQSEVIRQPNDETCDMCKYVVTYLDTFLEQNSTEAKIEGLLDKVCSILPQSWSQECDSLVKLYGPQIVKLLLQELQPDTVCTELGLCTGNKQGTASMKTSSLGPKKSNDINCDVCEYIMRYLESVLSENSTEAEIVAELKQVCKILPSSIEPECEQFVQNYLSEIVKLLVQELPPKEICTALGLCTGTASMKTSSLGPKKLNDINCDVCEYIMRYLESVLSENSTEAEIVAELKQVCKILPSSIEPECEQFVQNYLSEIVKLLVQELPPKEICTALGLCTGTAHLKTGILEPKNPNDITCDKCQYIVQYLETVLKENSSVAEIEEELEKVCDILPSSIEQGCKQFVQSYSSEIIKLLFQKLEPKQICAALGLCSGVPHSQAAIPEVQKVNDASCTMCEFVMQELDSYLTSNRTEPEIEAALNKVCDLMPVTIKAECELLVKQYASLITELLLQQLDPKKICTKLHLCKAVPHVAASSPKVAAPALKLTTPVFKVDKQKTEICALCESVMQELEDILKKYSMKGVVISALDRLCDFLPEKDKGLCIQYLPMFTGYIVDLVDQELPPKLICKLVKICVDDEVSVPRSRTPEHLVRKGESCSLCQFGCEEVYQLLKENITQVVIEAAFDKVCNVLPSTISSECLSFVHIYLPYVIDLIVVELPPAKLCQDLGLCNATLNQAGQSQIIKTNAVSTMKAGELCTPCTYAFQVLDVVLQNTAVKAEIEAALDHVCNHLPTYKDSCKQFIALYTPYVIDFITEMYTPTQICNKFRLCTDSASVIPAKSLTFTSEKIPVTTPPPFRVHCSACKFALYEIQVAMGDPFWQNKSRTILYELCTSYLVSGQAACKQLVDANFDHVISEIQAFLFPVEFCQMIEFCEPPVPALQAQTSCSFCKQIAQMVGFYVQQRKTVDEIKVLATSACSSQNQGAMTNQCVTMVQKYTLSLVKLVSMHSDPSTVCKAVSLCTKPSSGMLYKVIRPSDGK